MVKLLEKQFTRTDLLRHFGDYGVLAGYKAYTLRDGRGENVHITEIQTGGGLRFEINESRGMDIGNCYIQELPISYRSYIQDVHPTYHEKFSDGWLRSFTGGLLVTAGLTSMGSPEIDQGELLPMHGRISNLPAEDFHVEETWVNDELQFTISGKVTEAKALSYHVVLERVLKIKAGENKFTIYDTVSNEGFEDVEHMMLYHFNIGYPILDRDSRFYANSKTVTPRDEVARKRKEAYDTYLGPTPQYPDTVYFHDIQEVEGYCDVAIINHKRQMGVALHYKKDTLDHFTQWKFTGEGNYVAGLEPCNAQVNGRSIERMKKRVKILKAQEKVQYEIEVQILCGEEEIASYLARREHK